MSKHSQHSSYREKLIEHLLIGELLKLSWVEGDCELEVSKPEVDNAGYDILLERNGVLRHVQLKASHIGSTTSNQKIHTKLTSKPSGCVVWVIFDEDSVELGPFLFFGGAPGLPLPSLEDMKAAKHTKGDKDGLKAERPNIRVVNKGRFERLDNIKALSQALFGN